MNMGGVTSALGASVQGVTHDPGSHSPRYIWSGYTK